MKSKTINTIIRIITILLIITLTIIFGIEIAGAQTIPPETKTVNGKVYTVLTGSRGGKYILLESGDKLYVSNYSKPVLTNDTIAEYKGKKYPVHTGERGGKFIITETGSKIYIPKEDVAEN